MNSKISPDSIPPGSAPASTLSPRRRRLRWTIFWLAIGLVICAAAAVALYFASKPKPYRPDESNADLTSSLARSLPKNAPSPDFQDVTAAAGLNSFRNFQGNRTSQLPEDMGPGLAWGDFNNDGLEDLFLVSAGGPLNSPQQQLAPCALYQNLGNGKFQRVDAFPETRIHGMAAAWGDYDQDGFLDLIVTGYNTILLFHNEGGTGRFTRDTRFPDLKGFWSGAVWGDYDNDRCLDLYICGYVQFEENSPGHPAQSDQLGTFVPFTLNPSSFAPAKNLLFHNNGDGTFTEVGEKLGVTNPQGRSLGALWQDFDNDGWLDLYVANDVSDNVFYHNLGGTFEEISHPCLVADYRSAMGLAAGDYDRDGDEDLFISHWVGQENALYNNLWHDLQDASRTNHTAAPALPLRFMDVADMRGLGQIGIPFVGWGTEFADLDNDGWLDLIVVNGSTLEKEGTSPKQLVPQEPFLFWNDKGQFFYNLAPLNPELSQKHVSRGMAVCDFDNDGALDFAIAQLGEGVQLFKNRMRTGNWLKLQLKSLTKNRKPLGFGDGAKIILYSSGRTSRLTISSTSYLSQSSRIAHFGLDTATAADKIEVHWLGGGTNIYTHLSANATWQLVEEDPIAKRLLPHSPVAASPRSGQSATPGSEKERVLLFWQKHRAAMQAMKVEKNFAKAIPLFREALAADPAHEDAHYYLAQCLARQEDVPGALHELQTLIELNPQSHRAYQQWGSIRALSARSTNDLAAAEAALQKARRLNPEETGALLLLGEIALWQGNTPAAEEHLQAACKTNPKAANGFFLLSLLAWQRGDARSASSLLQQSRQALGPDWKPAGTTAEGDVQRLQHREDQPLAELWSDWNGSTNPAVVLPKSAARLSEKRLALQSPPH